jgi:Zn-dependent protease
LPVCLLLFELMTINVFLGVFNLIPVPPLDGSHVIRHFLPAGALKVYDTIGIFGLLALIYLAPGALSGLIYPVLGIFNSILARI